MNVTADYKIVKVYLLHDIYDALLWIFGIQRCRSCWSPDQKVPRGAKNIIRTTGF